MRRLVGAGSWRKLVNFNRERALPKKQISLVPSITQSCRGGMTEPSPRTCLIFRDVFGGWRWEQRNADGTVSESQVPYETRAACEQAARAAGLTLLTSPEFSLSGRSILCASAVPKIQNFVRQALTPAEIVIAARGDEALTLLNSAAFDCYVLDFWLPDWSGVSFCREIRRTDPHVPVCFYSTARGDDAKVRGLRAGADLYVVGPAEAEPFRRRIEQLLASRGEARDRAEADAAEAMQREFQRRTGVGDQRPQLSMSTSQLVERAVHGKGLEAFLKGGGIRADFERAWPRLLKLTLRLSARSA